jgi:hypothetical protein
MCEFAQGFHFSKAVGAHRAGELLRQGRIATSGDPSAEEHVRAEYGCAAAR